MLKKLENQINIWKAVSSSLLGTTSGYMFRKFIFENPDSTPVTWISIAIVIFAVTVISNFVLSSLIEKSSLIRKWILGNHFIEGYWIQNIETESYGLMHTVQYSLLKITYEKFNFKVEGTSFALDGSKNTANFYSHVTEFDGVILRYPFTVETLEFNKKNNIFGKTELHFSKVGKLPELYFGTVESNVRKKPVKVRGEKIKSHIHVDITTKRGREKLISYIKNR